MTNVELVIGGRTFVVACAEGEERHISGLGDVIDRKLDGFGDAGKLGETRMLLYAALFLADELQEARKAAGVGGQEGGQEGGQGTGRSARDAGAANEDAALVAIALNLENIASRLEHASTSP